MKAAHLAHGASATIAAQYIPDDSLSRYGVFAPAGETGEAFRVREIVEKPKLADAPSRYAVTARYVFSPDIYEAIRAVAPPEGGEIALTDAVTWLAKHGKTVVAVCLGAGQGRLDIGNPKSYAEAFQLLAESGTGSAA